MLVTFSVVDTSSKFVYQRKITFANNNLSLKDFIASKYDNIDRIIEIKVGSKNNDLISTDLSSINDITIADFADYKPCIIHVIVK